MPNQKLSRRAALSTAGAAITLQAVATPLTKAAAAEPEMIFFAFNSMELTPSEKRQTESLKRKIKPRARLLFTGHCDGAESQPDVLGLARAVEVLRVLAAAGLPAGVRLTATSAGNTKPLVKPPADGKEPQNRRVDVTIE